MMMKRKINRVKKEYQVYMHKVHVLCWLGHGNYVSRVLNDQEIMTAALALVPSKECYPGERVDMKYLEQITTWYKDKVILKQDKNVDKFRPKAPPLKNILQLQMKNKVVTSKKYLVFIFVAMLRALGLQCRVMFNFVTLPIKPHTSELCSLSTKPKHEKKNTESTSPATTSNTSSKQDQKSNEKKKATTTSKKKSSTKISQVDGNFDSHSESDSDFENIMQLDGSNDMSAVATRKTRTRKTKSTNSVVEVSKEAVTPPKRARKSPTPKTLQNTSKADDINKNNVNKTSSKQGDKSQVSIQKSNEDISSTQLKPGCANKTIAEKLSPRKTRSNANLTTNSAKDNSIKRKPTSNKLDVPKIVVTSDEKSVSSKYFESENNLQVSSTSRLSRKRSHTTALAPSQESLSCNKTKQSKVSLRAKSAPGKPSEKSKYFENEEKSIENKKPKLRLSKNSKNNLLEDKQRVSHRDLVKPKPKSKNDVTGDLVNIIKNRVKEAKESAKQGIVKGL